MLYSIYSYYKILAIFPCFDKECLYKLHLIPKYTNEVKFFSNISGLFNLFINLR